MALTNVYVSVASGDDDAEEADDGTGFTRTGTTLTPTQNSVAALRNNVGLRFANVVVPRGAIIHTAKLVVDVVDDSSESPKLDILAEAADDAVDFLSDADVTSRTRTAASVSWSDDNIGQGIKRSPDIAAVLQEVVNRPGFLSGNAIVLFLDGKDVADLQAMVFASVEHATGAPARLELQHGTPEGTPVLTIAIDVIKGPDRVLPG